jgi:hypothetical protein
MEQTQERQIMVAVAIALPPAAATSAVCAAIIIALERSSTGDAAR